jgi:hypothetical protein
VNGVPPPQLEERKVKIMQDTITLVIDFKNVPPRYPYITNGRDNYTSDMAYRSHMNYFKSKNSGGNPSEELLEGLAGGAVESVFNAVNQVLLEKQLKRVIDKAVRKAVEDSGGKWTND